MVVLLKDSPVGAYVIYKACILQAVLLIGFAQCEVDEFRKFMNDMEADMVKVIQAYSPSGHFHACWDPRWFAVM